MDMRAGDFRPRRPAKILEAIPRWVGDAVSDALAAKLRRARDGFGFPNVQQLLAGVARDRRDGRAVGAYPIDGFGIEARRISAPGRSRALQHRGGASQWPQQLSQ